GAATMRSPARKPARTSAAAAAQSASEGARSGAISATAVSASARTTIATDPSKPARLAVTLSTKRPSLSLRHGERDKAKPIFTVGRGGGRHLEALAAPVRAHVQGIGARRRPRRDPDHLMVP